MRKNSGYRNTIVIIVTFLSLILFTKNATHAVDEPEMISTKQIAYFTPDKDLNNQLKKGQVDPLEIFGISTTEEGLTINPSLKDGWTWLAVKNLPYGGKNISFFLFDGWLYTNESVFTPHRRQKFQTNISDLIHSNVFTLAFYAGKVIEKELVIFIASDKAVEAELIVDKSLWGEEKRITYALQAGEGHFISVMKMAEEFRPLYIPNDDATRYHIDFNQDWKFIRQDVRDAYKTSFNEEGWQNISIPHCWNNLDVYDMRNEYDGYEIYHGYYRGIGWYRKSFTLDSSLKQKKILLEFEAANQIADVWVNDNFVGRHVGGYTGFQFDITDYVQFGSLKNHLAIKVNNSYNFDVPPLTADFVMYGGIYREVRLLVIDKLYVKDIFITSPEVSDASANVNVKTQVINDSQKETEVILLTNVVSSESEIVASMKNQMIIKPGSAYQFDQTSPDIEYPELWSPDKPYLYFVYSTIYVDGKGIDEIATQFGFRYFSFDADKGFFLNGKPLKLRGVNKHQDYLRLGNAVPNELLVKDIKIIKEMGANFIRLAHYPHDPVVLDACDQMGLLVWEEIPLVNGIGGDKFAENTKLMIQEIIERDRNHPSVILWGITNESLMEFANKEQVPKLSKLLKELNDIAHKEDPTRLTVQAHNHFKDISIAGITDVIGRNRYYGWYEGVFEDFEKVMEQEHRDHPDWKIIISEYGVGSKLGYHVDNPKEFDFSEEYQQAFHEHYWKIIDERLWIAGSAVWNAFDFGSFVKRGNIPRINQKGLCDMARRPKDVYYFYQSQWTEEPMVYIVSHTRKRYAGPMNGTRRINVYSNCDSVELFLNGKSLGVKAQQYVFLWDVAFQPGENQLRAVAHKGNNIIEDQIEVTYIIIKD